MPMLAGEVSEDVPSDAESDDLGDILAEETEVKQQLNEELKDEGEEAGGDDDDEDDDEERFDVEEIAGHDWVKVKGEGTVLRYIVKWKGYPDTENTMEPIENLIPESKELLTTYHNTIGGVPQPPRKGPGKRKSTVDLKDQSDTPEPKRSKRDDSAHGEFWQPEGRNWDSQVQKVVTISKEPDTGKLEAMVSFKNGKRTIVALDVAYKSLPQSMLKFYENHLKFS